MMYLKRILLMILCTSFIACNRSTTDAIYKYNVGVVSYGQSKEFLRKYADLQTYLGTELSSTIELEPTYNEVRALRQIANQKWDVVFAPPGLAAIAVSKHNYQPIMSLEGNNKNLSAIIVGKNSSYQQLQELAGKTIALGQKGSATGYYFPLYNLYGVPLADTVFAPTPQKVLQWIKDGTVEAGALSIAEYNLYRRNFSTNSFRVLYLDRHHIPSGAILISDHIERNQEEQIRAKLNNVPSSISSSAGFLPHKPLPEYDYLIKVIQRVQDIEEQSTSTSLRSRL